jgi:hypothetical protein
MGRVSSNEPSSKPWTPINSTSISPSISYKEISDFKFEISNLQSLPAASTIYNPD